MNILFLQGLATPFFMKLGLQLAQDGHNVHKIHFCGGDFLFWQGGVKNVRSRWHTHFYRKKIDILPQFYQKFLKDHRIDRVVLFGDTRPIHEAALAACREAGITVHVFEEGYVRPYWITMDKNGTNAASNLSRDPEYYLGHYANHELQEKINQSVAVGGGLKRRVIMDAALHIANLLAWPIFIHYRTHRPWIAGVEYFGFLMRALRHLKRRRLYGSRIERLNTSKFFLLPLQLDSDSQIWRHSDFENMTHVIKTVMESFFIHAPEHSVLAIKLHPLDNGLRDYEHACYEAAKTAGIQDRIVFFSGGSMPDLLRKASGVITVNSTAGFSSLIHGLKVKTLGRALYDIKGLTWSGSLDDFWKADFKPDKILLRAFRAGLIAESQINGNFFTRAGIDIGSHAAKNRIERFVINEH